MHLMHEEDVVGDTYMGFIHVFEADEEGVVCDRCRTKLFRGNLLIAFDGAGEWSSFDDVAVCEACLTDMGSQANPRATAEILRADHFTSIVEWTEVLTSRHIDCPGEAENPERTIVMRFDWDDGLFCDRCFRTRTVPIYSFDGTGGIYDALNVCETCVKDLLEIGRTSMLSVDMDRMAID